MKDKNIIYPEMKLIVGIIEEDILRFRMLMLFHPNAKPYFLCQQRLVNELMKSFDPPKEWYGFYASLIEEASENYSECRVFMSAVEIYMTFYWLGASNDKSK